MINPRLKQLLEVAGIGPIPASMQAENLVYDSLADVPAGVVGPVFTTDGLGITVNNESIKLIGGFIGSIYSGLKSATTTVTGQSEAFATGATKLQITNNDATNSLIIGMGNSAAEAETNCDTGGTAGINKFLLLAKAQSIIATGTFTHYAWLGVGGTVEAQITQGV